MLELVDSSGVCSAGLADRLPAPWKSARSCSQQAEIVGRCAGSLQLAALAPSVALCDITFYLFRGLGATTTAFVAAADADGDDARAARAVHTSVVLAALLGVAVGALLYAGCPPLLQRLSGAAAGDKLLAEARGYVRVRALGMPAGMIFMVLQASFLLVRVRVRANPNPNPNPHPHPNPNPNPNPSEVVPLEDLLSLSDFVSVHCPLNDQTRGLIGAEVRIRGWVGVS